MNNEQMLEKTLNATLERFGRQAISYESEIANLNAQIIVMQHKIEELSSAVKNATEQE